MLYKFKSKAAGDVIMLAANGDQVLRILGRQPAPKGILEVADMPAALTAIESAIEESEQARRDAEAEALAEGKPPPAREAVSLRQRVWPLGEMIKRSHAAKADIVWGV
jgi:Domain of unknown function (DUF1840)